MATKAVTVTATATAKLLRHRPRRRPCFSCLMGRTAMPQPRLTVGESSMYYAGGPCFLTTYKVHACFHSVKCQRPRYRSWDRMLGSRHLRLHHTLRSACSSQNTAKLESPILGLTDSWTMTTKEGSASTISNEAQSHVRTLKNARIAQSIRYKLLKIHVRRFVQVCASLKARNPSSVRPPANALDGKTAEQW